MDDHTHVDIHSNVPRGPNVNNISDMMSLNSSSLPFFPLPNPLLLELGPLFVNPTGDNPLRVNPMSLLTQPSILTLEALEREKL